MAAASRWPTANRGRRHPFSRRSAAARPPPPTQETTTTTTRRARRRREEDGCLAPLLRFPQQDGRSSSAVPATAGATAQAGPCRGAVAARRRSCSSSSGGGGGAQQQRHQPAGPRASGSSCRSRAGTRRGAPPRCSPPPHPHQQGAGDAPCAHKEAERKTRKRTMMTPPTIVETGCTAGAEAHVGEQKRNARRTPERLTPPEDPCCFGCSADSRTLHLTETRAQKPLIGTRREEK